MIDAVYLWLRSRFLFVFFVVPVVLAFVGPFGTYTEMTFPYRLIYWGTLCFGIGVLMVSCIAFAMSTPSKSPVRLVLRVVSGAAVAAVPGSALVFVMYLLMREAPMEPEPGRLALLWFQVTVVGVMVTFVEILRARATEPQAATPEPESVAPPEDTSPIVTALHARLPPELGNPAEIISLSMQDHYCEVTCEKGSDLHLTRLSDAVAELDGLDGLRIHRSHWVALSHLRCLRRKGHRHWVTLSDGRELPVSQTYLEDVRAALNETVSAP